MSGLQLTNNVSITLLASIFTALGVAGSRLLDAWRAKARVDRVDVPQVQAQGWVELFKVANDSAMRLTADVAKLEKRLDDQDEEHRIELADRDQRYAELAQMHSETAGSLRRLRSYVIVVTNLLNEHGIAFPPMPDEDVAPERRTPTITTALVVDSKEQTHGTNAVPGSVPPRRREEE